MALTRRSFTALSLGWLAAGPRSLAAQEWTPNYDESKVPPYQLPPLLQMASGRRVRTITDWQARSLELLELFSSHVYGRTPVQMPRPKATSIVLLDESSTPQWPAQPELPASPRFHVTVHEAAVPALDGLARRTQLALSWPEHPDVRPIEVLLYQPAASGPAVPVFVGLNFYGNHAVHRDPGIRLSSRWMRSNEQTFIRDHRATERSRGTTASRWPIETILEAGCAVMTVYYGDLAPDDPAQVADGVAPLFAKAVEPIPIAERWGALGMWAWGLSQMRTLVDALPELDSLRVAVLGHSRLGKAALWAGAQDGRFALVISNNSGCGGAALSRRAYGETVGRITRAFPHWFCSRFASYAEREGDLPVDQHQLLALMAPRHLYVASAVEDRWADPRGEFLSAAAVTPVYGLWNRKALGTDTMPPIDTPIGDAVRYHVRTGGHDVTMYDWRQYLEAMAALPAR